MSIRSQSPLPSKLPAGEGRHPRIGGRTVAVVIGIVAAALSLAWSWALWDFWNQGATVPGINLGLLKAHAVIAAILWVVSFFWAADRRHDPASRRFDHTLFGVVWGINAALVTLLWFVGRERVAAGFDACGGSCPGYSEQFLAASGVVCLVLWAATLLALGGALLPERKHRSA